MGVVLSVMVVVDPLPPPPPLSFRDLIAESRSGLLKPCRSALDPAIMSRGDNLRKLERNHVPDR